MTIDLGVLVSKQDITKRLKRIRAARLNAREVEKTATEIVEELKEDRALAKAVGIQLLKFLLEVA